MTTIQVTTSSDSITLTGTEIENRWIYDNEALTSWYALADVEVETDSRPNAHGIYGLGELYTIEHRTTIPGQFFGTTIEEALIARNRLSALFNDGRSLVLAVTDDLGMTMREAWLIDFDAPWKPDTHFRFTIAFIEPDPRRYGPPIIVSDGLPSGSSGLVWDLGTAPSGLFFDWGSEGTLGQVAFTNEGQAASSPVIEVGGAGGFDAGFRVTEIETSRELTFTRPTGLGETVRFDSRTGRATINGGDVTRFMTSRRWFTVPKGATRRYQLTPLGGTTGAPTIRLIGQPANL